MFCMFHFFVFLICASALGATAVAESATTVPSKQDEDIPLLTIGNERLMPSDLRVQALESSMSNYPLPEVLKPDNMRIFLNRRVNYLPFDHQPRLGNDNAPIRILEAADIDCAACMGKLHEVRQALSPYQDHIQWVFMHYPTDAATEIPTAPFYARVAADFDAFWPYLQRIMQEPSTPDKPTLLNMLVRMISADAEVRQAIATKTETYYSHLDTDVEIAKDLKLKSSPAWLVNGIRVEEINGIPPKLIATVVNYELQRKGIKIKNNVTDANNAEQ